MRFNFDELYRKEWRALGFYYEYNLETWTLVGDIAGLSRFPTILKDYAQEPPNQGLGEHIHVGPYQYFKIVTSEVPFIGKDGVYGSLEDLNRLSDLFANKLLTGNNFTIDEEYSESNEADINVILKDKGFDPSTLDKVITS